MVAFWGKILVECLKRVFKFKDDEFLHKVMVVLGESFLDAVYRYRTNADIASLFLAWCLKLCFKEEVFWIVMQCAREEWCWGLALFMAIARPGKGFVAVGGDWLHVGEVVPPLRPFFIWEAYQDKEICRVAVQIGLGEIKNYLRMLENRTCREEREVEE
ncbi:hypothetical protein SUGI_0742610 [Cryptomeria japonica]|nr:hypothetical protein SUGI_0742610 [Cryptomeria japonica]